MIIPIDKLLTYIQVMLEAEIENCKDEIEAKTMLLEQLKKNRSL